jgi:hypothetical protein
VIRIIPGNAGYAHFNDIYLYPAVPGTRTERVNIVMNHLLTLLYCICYEIQVAFQIRVLNLVLHLIIFIQFADYADFDKGLPGLS